MPALVIWLKLDFICGAGSVRCTLILVYSEVLSLRGPPKMCANYSKLEVRWLVTLTACTA